MKKLIYLAIFTLFCLTGFGQSQFQPLIIDTDGATDDFRAITAFLAVKDLPVLAITTCSGSLTAQQTFEKVDRLITSLQLDIPIAKGSAVYTDVPSWRSVCMDVNWGTKQRYWPPTVEVMDVMEKQIKASKQKVVYIALGSLGNISDFITKKKDLLSKISKVIWYNPDIRSGRGFNYEIDKPSLDVVLQSGIKLEVIHSLRLSGLKWNDALVKQLSNDVPSAAMIKQRFQSNEIPHSYMMDELLAAYFFYPEWFDMKPDVKNPFVSQVTAIDTSAVKECLIRVYNNRVGAENNIAFDRFPSDKSSFKYDIAKEAERIIKSYGLDEWRACVLTNEIHGHLGVYSIVGAKMGLKARELLNAPIDRINVLTYAGSLPPTSCLNDGLQISTGATLGLGMIKLAKTKKATAMAEFEFNGKKIRMKLKPELEKKIQEDLDAGIAKYGNLTDGYWKLVRALSVKYWAEWNRNEMFEVEFLK